MHAGSAGIQGFSASDSLQFVGVAVSFLTLFDAAGNILAIAEDIGRHNALDKAIGRALLAGNLNRANFLNLSSRVSYEMVQKSARAGVAVVFSVSRPTGLAVELASRLEMALACFAPGNGVYVFCGQSRLRLAPT